MIVVNIRGLFLYDVVIFGYGVRFLLGLPCFLTIFIGRLIGIRLISLEVCSVSFILLVRLCSILGFVGDILLFVVIASAYP